MALKGTIEKSLTGRKYIIEWSATQSVANNTSTITCVHKLKSDSTYALNIGSRTNSCSVGSDTKSFTSGAISTGGGSTITLGTTTHTVKHNDDGAKSVTIKGVFNIQATLSGTYVESLTASGTVTLDTIARASVPTLSASSVAMKSTVTITTNRKSSSFTHDLSYSFGDGTGTIATGVGASYKWEVPVLVANIPNKKSATCTITCKTKSGDTVVGTKTVTLTLTIPISSPTVSASSVAMKESVTITTNRVSKHLTHDLTYSFAGRTGTIATGVEAAKVWTVPDLVAKIPGKKSGICTIVCKTKNGTALVGTKTVTLTLNIPAASQPSAEKSTVQMGSKVNVYTNRKSTAYTHTLTYKIGDKTGTIDTTVAGGRTWTPPKSLAAYTGNELKATCTITCKTYNGSLLVGTKTTEIILTVPDATVPTLSASSIVLGNSITLSTPREADCYEHLITYILKAEGSSTVAYENKFSGPIQTSYVWTPDLKTLAKKIPSATKGTITISCETRFKDSTTVIGIKKVSFTVTVPNNNTTKPVVDMSVSAVETPFAGVYVQGKSRVKVNYTASSDYSTIKSYATSLLSDKGSTDPYTSHVLSKAGSVKITGKVTDARGYFTTKENSITVIDYRRPRIIPGEGKNSLVCVRCNSDGKADPGGVRLLIQIGRMYSKVMSGSTQKNYCKLSYQWKTDDQDDSEYSEPVTLLARTATSDYVNKNLSGIVTSIITAYNIRLIAEDDVGETDTVIITVPTAFATWHSPPGGHGFTLGGYHDPSKKDVFDCKFDAEFEGDVYGRVLGMGGLPKIPDGANFNDYKNFGCYSVSKNENAATLLNCPSDEAGTLRVWSANGSGKTTGNWVYIMQEYIPYSNTAVYRRLLKVEDEDSVWTYKPWKTIWSE